MICEDCIFEMGLEEYEYHNPSRRGRYRCKRCDEIVPSPNGNYLENRLLDAMELKEKKLKKHLPISFVKFKRNCKHNQKRLYPGSGTCFYKKKRKGKRKYFPDICCITGCPLLSK